MAIQLDEDGQRCVVRLEGEIGIADSTELKTALLAAISSGKQVQVDWARVTSSDVTAVQLFWAAAREAEKTRTGFEFSGPDAGAIAQLAREIGLAALAVEAAPVSAGKSADDR